MKKVILLLLLVSLHVEAQWSGKIELQSQIFIEDAQYNNQFEEDFSLSFNPKFSTTWNNANDVFSTEYFVRVGSKDEERNHMDFRELMWLHVDGDYEWRLGIDTVFWGVTESINIVDVINQKDSVEGSGNDKKLGQTMLHLTSVKDWGIIDSYILLGFAERTFAGEQGRPRNPLVVDADTVEFESSQDERHIDYAIRFSHYYDDVDYAFSLFKGTQREPLFSQINSNGEAVLQPYYQQMTQFSVEAQTIVEAWLWKFEGIYNDSNSGHYSAMTTGFEYSFYSVFDSAAEIGSIAEYIHDSRAEKSSSSFNQDLFLGARMTFNDIQSSSILAGFLIDFDNKTRLLRVEGERRLGDEWTLKGEVILFGKIDKNDPLKVVEKDNSLHVELAFNF